MKILVDMNLTPRWISFLVENGVDAVHWSSIGDCKAKDRLIVQWAIQNGFWILTNDLDFPQILAHTRAP